MDNFTKIVNPANCDGWTTTGRRVDAPGFCKIEYKDGRLSITGVIGPRSSGNCSGSAGQCVDKIRKGRPINEWTEEMLQKFCDIWDLWHLNDMRAYCSHQKELGWREQAVEPVTIYYYHLNESSRKEQDRAKRRAINSLKDGKPFFPTQDEVFYANLEYSIKTVGHELDGEMKDYYEPEKKTNYSRPSEVKIRGWIGIDESPLGLLCKPCPVCGYKYGTSWLHEEVPEDVLQWLRDLPDTKRQPAWI